MNAPTTAIDRFYDLCDEFERRFGESFWMPAGCGLSTADGIYAIKSAIEAGECRNGYAAFGPDHPHAVASGGPGRRHATAPPPRGPRLSPYAGACRRPQPSSASARMRMACP